MFLFNTGFELCTYILLFAAITNITIINIYNNIWTYFIQPQRVPILFHIIHTTNSSKDVGGGEVAT